MLASICDNISTIIICAVLIAIVALIIVFMRRSRNKGAKCSCGCGCKHCALSDGCHNAEK